MISSAIVLGAGSWGTALAGMLGFQGIKVQFWGRDEALMRDIATTRRNARYLPDLQLPDNVTTTHQLGALQPADIVVFVTPSRALRSVAAQLQASAVIQGASALISCTKGIELQTGKSMSQILEELFPGHCYAALSGPNHAEEIARKMPSAGVVACADAGVALQLQSAFSLPWFRCYTSDDVAGVEWAGAMKNPYAIAAGIALGLNLGDNAIAALVTRGLAEMVRLGVAQGGRAETFYGLSGVGDLVATCYSEHSRNHRVGKMLGQGHTLESITSGTHMVAEGVPNTESLWQCSRSVGVRTPLLDEVYAVLYQGKSPQAALKELFSRDPRPEVD